MVLLSELQHQQVVLVTVMYLYPPIRILAHLLRMEPGAYYNHLFGEYDWIPRVLKDFFQLLSWGLQYHRREDEEEIVIHLQRWGSIVASCWGQCSKTPLGVCPTRKSIKNWVEPYQLIFRNPLGPLKPGGEHEFFSKKHMWSFWTPRQF